MYQVLLVTKNKEDFQDLSEYFKNKGLNVSWRANGESALAEIIRNTYDLMVVNEDLGDMTGLDYIKKSLYKNPMIHTAAVSSLSEADYHEASEGMGVLMQLPPRPGRPEAEKLFKHLETILNASMPLTQ